MRNKYIIFVLICYFHSSVFAQIVTPEFVTTFYFKDSKNNKDSIELGFDKDGDYWELQDKFGEVDITNEYFSQELDVRIGKFDIFKKINAPLSKRKILLQNNYCEDDSKVPFAVDIRMKNFPITMSWDTSKFQDPCLGISGFARTANITLYDFTDPTRIYFKNKGFLTIDEKYTKSCIGGTCPSFLGNIDANNKENIQVFYGIFAKKKSTIATNDFMLQEKIDIFPNPAINKLTLKKDVDLVISDKTKVDVINNVGQIILSQNATFENSALDIDISNFEKGLYFVRLIDEEQAIVFRSKILKIE